MPVHGSTDGHVERAFNFRALPPESVRTMNKHGNQAGLDAAVAAIPAVKPLVDSLYQASGSAANDAWCVDPGFDRPQGQLHARRVGTAGTEASCTDGRRLHMNWR